MRLLNLTTTSFRNLEHSLLEWSPETNLIVGDNGAGKTNLLEAICVLTTLNSFRTKHQQGIVRHGETEFSVAGEIAGEAGRRRLEQTVSVAGPRRRELRVDQRGVATKEFLALCPVFAITAATQHVVTGAPVQRRRFVDRFAFLLEPNTLDELRRYQRTLRQRNAALARSATDQELTAWDERLAAAAARLTVRRARATTRLTPTFAAVYESYRGATFPEVGLSYVSGAWLNPHDSLEIVEESYRKRYNETRARDRRVGSTVEGPHRHDVCLDAHGRPVREVLSSGQIKVVAAALLLAAVEIVERDRGEPLPVVMDDVDAELDREVFSRLSEQLVGTRQLFVSSARPEAVSSLLPRSTTLRIKHGRCERVHE